jgi:predicted  nucleic acid-binding Zn-ribbon protein
VRPARRVSAVADGGDALTDEQCRRLMELPATANEPVDVAAVVSGQLDEARTQIEQPILDAVSLRNGRWFDIEVDKLDRWTDDRKGTLKTELDELDKRVKELKKEARSAGTLPEKLERQRAVKRLEARRDEAWREFDRASRELDGRKDDLLDEVQRRMLTYVERNELFTVRWELH